LDRYKNVLESFAINGNTVWDKFETELVPELCKLNWDIRCNPAAKQGQAVDWIRFHEANTLILASEQEYRQKWRLGLGYYQSYYQIT